MDKEDNLINKISKELQFQFSTISNKMCEVTATSCVYSVTVNRGINAYDSEATRARHDTGIEVDVCEEHGNMIAAI